MQQWDCQLWLQRKKVILIIETSAHALPASTDALPATASRKKRSYTPFRARFCAAAFPNFWTSNLNPATTPSSLYFLKVPLPSLPPSP